LPRRPLKKAKFSYSIINNIRLKLIVDQILKNLNKNKIDCTFFGKHLVVEAIKHELYGHVILSLLWRSLM